MFRYFFNSLYFDLIMNPTHYESISVTWAIVGFKHATDRCVNA